MSEQKPPQKEKTEKVRDSVKTKDNNKGKVDLSKDNANTTQPLIVANNPMNVVHQQVMCTPGLEYLLSVDQLIVKQKIHLLEVVTGFEPQNRYVVQNIMGQPVYEAKEVSGCCDRFCCGQIRPFDMEIMDTYNREVIHMRRPLRCDSCLFFCCLQELQVEAPKGNIIGHIIQDCSLCYPVFHIENSLHQTVFRIEGPLCPCSLFCNDVHFDVLAANQDLKVAQISKLWSGCLRENFTDSDFFRIAFPLDMDVNMKAVLLSAAFLIDYMYFEI